MSREHQEQGASGAGSIRSRELYYWGLSMLESDALQMAGKHVMSAFLHRAESSRLIVSLFTMRWATEKPG
jgi:hypothetical protein